MSGSILSWFLTKVLGQRPSVQQVSLIRKLIYLGLILALLTTSYFYRTLAAEPQAQALALRDRDVGEVELTGSAMRLSLTGLRGLATCVVWVQAMDKFKKGQWEELDLLVTSATRLQPHFNTPWQFQSWNMAFNVVNRCDQPGDKYFYIARGLQLLAQGERQNRYDPELRYHIGLFYQMRIGRWEYWPLMCSLLELSCIDPVVRDPARFGYTTADQRKLSYSQTLQLYKTRLEQLEEQAREGKLPTNPQEWPAQVKAELEQIEQPLKNFDAFCTTYPRLIRRLREPPNPRLQKAMVSPDDIIAFLQQHQDLPSLYGTKREKHGDEERTERKRNKDNPFPVWPQKPETYDPEQLPAPPPEYLQADLDGEKDPHDIFLESRAWYAFSQEPLPEPNRERPGESLPVTDPIKQRIPKHMMTVIFRNYPARARAFAAERLAEEGWFDSDGWVLEWDPAVSTRRLVLGHSVDWGKDAWKRAADDWARYGHDNGLELSPEELQQLDRRARLYRDTYLREPGAMPTQPRDADEQMQKSFEAADRLHWYRSYRRLVNFPHHYHRALVEQQDQTVAARKALYDVKREEQGGLPPEALREKFEDALEQWRGVLIANPVFAADRFTQEDTNELGKRYMDLFVKTLAGERLKELLLMEAALGQGLGSDVGLLVTQNFRASRAPAVAPPTGVVYAPRKAGPGSPRTYAPPGAIISPDGPLDDNGKPVFKLAAPLE